MCGLALFFRAGAKNFVGVFVFGAVILGCFLVAFGSKSIGARAEARY